MGTHAVDQRTDAWMSSVPSTAYYNVTFCPVQSGTSTADARDLLVRDLAEALRTFDSRQAVVVGVPGLLPGTRYDQVKLIQPAESVEELLGTLRHGSGYASSGLHPIDPSTADELGTSMVQAASTRWGSYVNRRLQEMWSRSLSSTDPYPGPALIILAWETVRKLFPPDTPPPSVVPSEESGVRFVWHKDGWDLEIDVELEGTVAWARNRKTDDATSWEGPLAESQGLVVGLLEEFASA